MKKLFLILTLISFAFISCEEDEVVQPDDSILTIANVSGSLNLYDEYNNAITNSGMVVYLEGMSGSYWGESEKDGSFLILNAPYHDNYTVVYQKQGYGTYKYFGFNHEYSGSIGTIGTVPSLGKISTTYVTMLDANESEENVVFDVGVATSPSTGTYIRFLFHHISGISHEVFSHYSLLKGMSASENTFVFSKAQLQEIGLESGTKYWVQAYGDSFRSNRYFDQFELKYVLPNLGFDPDSSVPTQTFVMP